MKVLIVGDLHLTNSKPRNRVDDYAETLKEKFRFILQTAKEEDCEVVLSPGDFWNSPNPSYEFFCEIIAEIEEQQIQIITIPGQHDLEYRNFENTALRALGIKSKWVKVLTAEDPHIIINGIDIYASPFNKPIPEIEDKKSFNILLIHRMIIQEKIWEGQKNCEPSNVFLRQQPFDLIVSGDNHNGFYQSFKGKYLFNCGSMMRSTTAQTEHKPFIVVFDTEKPDKYKIIYIPIEPAEKVFSLEDVQSEKGQNKSLKAFTEGLSENKEMGLVIEDNFNQYFKEEKIETEISDIIWECARG
jgi:DNA repair exonuclease SbcCD nuclease subunit